jgi:DNA-binding transcriptional LysR family regulator
MNVELRHLRYFIAVAEELHFGRAAARLHIVQPALSQQIQRLEATLELKLLERDRRRVALTDAGRAFLAEAYLTLEHADRAVQVAARAQRGELGRLRVGIAASAAQTSALDSVSAFSRDAPDVQLEVRELPMRALLGALRGDGVDIGFMAMLELPADTDGMTLHELSRDPLVAAIPDGHRLARRATVRLAELADEPFAAYPREAGAAWHDAVVALCRRAGFTPRRGPEVREVNTQLALVAAGLGVALVPVTAAILRARGVAFVPLSDPDVPHVTSAASWREDDTSRVLYRFRAHLRPR